MNAKIQAKILRARLGLSGRVDVFGVADTLELDIDHRQFQTREVEEITVGSSIAISDCLDSPARRWAIAHAIGHHVMHPSNQVWLRMETLMTDKFEREAEDFAFWLLIDLHEVQHEGLNTADGIAEYFSVPVDMVRKHLI